MCWLSQEVVTCQDDIKLGKNVKTVKNISFIFIGYKNIQGKKK